MPDNIDKVFLLNPNIEIRNPWPRPGLHGHPNHLGMSRQGRPKQYQNPNVNNLKQMQITTWILCFFLKFGFLSLEFFSYFGIRISEFTVSDKWIKRQEYKSAL